MTDILNQNLKDQENHKFPQIMGILNVTGDSFSDGGNYIDFSAAIDHSLRMIENGADIIDIGGESTRPGALSVDLDAELERTIPIIQKIREFNKDILLSIDTTKYDVAKEALIAGANIINDISGLTFEPRFVDLAKDFKSDLVIMHMQGTPRDMQKSPKYSNLLKEIYIFFEERIALANNLGLESLIIDVGIGFGKTVEHNIELLRNLSYFDNLKAKKLLGISRKSFLGKIFNIEIASDRDMETVIFHSLLLKNNIDIVRVHNVKAIKSLKTAYELLN
jgi:dihydropteroate synthase